MVDSLRAPVAYPGLVSEGGSTSRKLNWLVKVGASKGVTLLIKKSWPGGAAGGGGFPGNQKTPWIRHCALGDCSLVRTFCSPNVRESELKGSLFRRFVSPTTTLTAFCYKGSVVRRFVSPK